jgi:hypothetical protein
MGHPVVIRWLFVSPGTALTRAISGVAKRRKKIATSCEPRHSRYLPTGLSFQVS